MLGGGWVDVGYWCFLGWLVLGGHGWCWLCVCWCWVNGSSYSTDKVRTETKTRKLNKVRIKINKKNTNTRWHSTHMCVFCFFFNWCWICVAFNLTTCRKDEEKQLDELLFVMTLAIFGETSNLPVGVKIGEVVSHVGMRVTWHPGFARQENQGVSCLGSVNSRKYCVLVVTRRGDIPKYAERLTNHFAIDIKVHEDHSIIQRVYSQEQHELCLPISAIRLRSCWPESLESYPGDLVSWLKKRAPWLSEEGFAL